MKLKKKKCGTRAPFKESYSGVLNGTQVHRTRVPCKLFIYLLLIFLKF